MTTKLSKKAINNLLIDYYNVKLRFQDLEKQVKSLVSDGVINSDMNISADLELKYYKSSSYMRFKESVCQELYPDIYENCKRELTKNAYIKINPIKKAV